MEYETARASNGRLIHAIRNDVALCGFKPKNEVAGRGGWRGSAWYVTTSKLTCNACRKALEKVIC